MLLIGFWLLGKYMLVEVGYFGIIGYSVKLIIVILLILFIYLFCFGVWRIFGCEEVECMVVEVVDELYKL